MYKMRVQTTEYQEVITIRAAKLLGLGALTRALNILELPESYLER